MAAILHDSPFGPLLISARAGALIGLDWDRPLPEGEAPGAVPVLDTARRQLDRYFSGGALDFDLPLAPRGTPFQHRVWAEMRAVPPGQTRSYGWVAARLGSSARAVGGACPANPIAIIIPCHRIVAAGGLGGYGGARRALDIKRRLLEHEGASMGSALAPGVPMPDLFDIRLGASTVAQPTSTGGIERWRR